MNMGLITVHYRSVDRPNQDVNKISIQKPEGTAFDVHKYVKRLPKHPRPYYFCQVVKSTSQFTQQPQDVIIFVRAYLQAKIDFKDSRTHRVVASHNLYARKLGESINYSELSRKYLPNKYEPLKPVKRALSSHNSPVFIPGMTEIIYVKPLINHQVHQTDPGQPHASSQGHQVTAKLYYKEEKTGDRKKFILIHGTQDHPVNYQRYQRPPYVPNGYEVTGLGTNTGKFLEPNAEYSILIKRKSHPKVTGKVVYQDIDNNLIKDMKRITGRPGMSMSEYLKPNSRYIPNGYHFVKVSTHYSSQLKNHAIYIVKIKKNRTKPSVNSSVNRNNVNNAPHNSANQSRPSTNVQASQSASRQQHTGHQLITGKLIYRDPTAGKNVKIVLVTGYHGMMIPVNHYTSSHMLPQGYRYERLGSTDWKLRAKQRYFILIKPRQKLNSQTNHQPHRSYAGNNSVHNPHESVNNSSNRNGANVNHQHYQNTPGQSQSQSKLRQRASSLNTNVPRINGSGDIGSILVALGSSLSALGKALAHDKNYRK